MHFYTFFLTTATLALVNAKPAMMRRFGNETISAILTATDNPWLNVPLDTTVESGNSISAILTTTDKTSNLPTSTTVGSGNSISTMSTTTTISAIPTTTDTPGSNSPTITTDESGSSISAIVITVPIYAMPNTTDGAGNLISTSLSKALITNIESTTLTYTLGSEGSSSIVTTVVESTSTTTMTSTIYITLTRTEEPSTPDATTTDLSENATTDFNYGPTVTNTGDTPSGNNARIDPTEANTSSPVLSAPSEPTVTITDYSTTTETITLQAVSSGSVDGFNNGAFFQSNRASVIMSGGQNGECGVTTVTATIVEKSTVTVTPTSTDSPMVSPSYGNGNGTLSSYGPGSSGLLTFYKRAGPTIS